MASDDWYFLLLDMLSEDIIDKLLAFLLLLQFAHTSLKFLPQRYLYFITDALNKQMHTLLLSVIGVRLLGFHEIWLEREYIFLERVSP